MGGRTWPGVRLRTMGANVLSFRARLPQRYKSSTYIESPAGCWANHSARVLDPRNLLWADQV